MESLRSLDLENLARAVHSLNILAETGYFRGPKEIPLTQYDEPAGSFVWHEGLKAYRYHPA